MRAPLRTLALAACALGAVLGLTLTYTPAAGAARNSSGTHSLPQGTVVTGTVISSSYMNSTLTDLSTEVTNSLDRQGRGAMLAPLQLASGSSSAPGLTFSAEPASGLYRAGAGDVRLRVGGADAAQWTASGVRVASGSAAAPGLAFQSATTSGLYHSGSDVRVAASGAAAHAFGANALSVVDPGGTNAGLNTAGALLFGGLASTEGIASKRTASGNQNGLDFYTAGAQRLSITSTGGVQIPGATATAPGTAITGIYGAAYSIDMGAIAGGSCKSPDSCQTLTGAAVGATCLVSLDAAGSGANGAILSCYVSGANTVCIDQCQPSGFGWGAGARTYYVRVIQ